MKRGLVNAVRNPVEMAMFIYSLGVFLFALFILSPWYVGSPGGSIWLALHERIAELITGVIFIVVSLPGTMIPFVKKPNREKFAKRSALWLFLCFLFLAILRVLIFGWLPATWIPLIILSLTSGGFRLFYEVRQE
jgi:hypothetical protein